MPAPRGNRRHRRARGPLRHAAASLVALGRGEIDRIDVCFEGRDLGRRDRQPEFGLFLGQHDPQPRQVRNFRCGLHSRDISAEA